MEQIKKREQIMKDTIVQIVGMISIFDATGVEKQIKRRNGVVRVDANCLSGTATIFMTRSAVAPEDTETFIVYCRYHCSGDVTDISNRKTIKDYENERY